MEQIIKLQKYTSSTSVIVKDVLDLFERIRNKNLLVRRLSMSANHVINKNSAMKNTYEQLNLFDLMNKQECKEEKEFQEKEENIQKAVLDIKNKFGKNAIFKGIVLSEKYDDIIKLPHFVSKRYPQMSMHDRAAQFSPFAALTGYDDLVKETARITDQKVYLDAYILNNLNERLCILKKKLSERTEVDITYF